MQAKRINATTTLVTFDTEPMAVVVLEHDTPVAAFKEGTAYVTDGKVGVTALYSLRTYLAGVPWVEVKAEWLESFYKRGGIL